MGAPLNKLMNADVKLRVREAAVRRERQGRGEPTGGAGTADRAPRMAGDALQLSGPRPRVDGQARRPMFDRADGNRDGSLSRKEFDGWLKQRAERGAPEPPAAPPAAPAAFGYQTRHAHPVSQLAQDFGVAPEALMALNGWADPGHLVPAGSRVNLPDSAETRGLASQYGGQIGEAVTPGEAAPPIPAGAPGGLAAGGVGIAGDPNDVHMTQFVHERFNNSPNAPWGSANCGPTSLAMALKAVGLQPAGLPAGADTEAWIDTTREAMGAMTDAYGHWGDSAYTDISQVIAGAAASGGVTAPVSYQTLDAALAEGLPVVAAGNPAMYNYDWQERGISNSEYDGGHFITVTGKAANGNYVINDPLSNVGAVEISPAQMQDYMSWFGPGAAVSVANGVAT